MGVVEELMCGVYVTVSKGSDRYDLASTLCEYDLRTGDLFIMSWASVRWVSISIAANVWWRCA